MDVDKDKVNICGHNGLLDLGKIIQYYLKNGNFLNIKNGNTASNKLLISLCKNTYRININQNRVMNP